MLQLILRASDNIWRMHSAYNLVGGIWAVVHMRSFEAITGPKHDRWLVRTVGALISVIGAAIAAAGARDRITPEVTGVAIGSSASLAAVDIIYVSRGRISRVYLLDALAQFGLISGWLMRRRRKQSQVVQD